VHTIILVEQYKLNTNGDLEVTAILENEQRESKGTYLFRAPEVAPIRAKATIYKQTLPPGVSFQGKGTRELTEMIDRYQLFLNQDWKPLDSSGPDEKKDTPRKGGRLFF
jgi:hypothetical protein